MLVIISTSGELFSGVNIDASMTLNDL